MMELVERGYLNIFKDREGFRYGLRLGNPTDASSIMNAYIEIFGFEYTDSVVYDQEKLAEDIAKKNTFWFIGECLEADEPDFCGGGAIDIDDPVTSHMSKVVIRPKYQRRGLASEMGIKGIFKIFQFPEFKNVLRMNAGCRASNKYTQLTMRNQGSKPYGFNPICVNLGDRRWINKKEEKPYLKGDSVPIIYYIRTLNDFWKQRENVIHLYDNEDILYFYDFQTKINRYAKKNDLLITTKNSKNKMHFIELKQDYNLGAINIKGYIHNILLKMYITKFKKWRYIEWRIPTTEEGIHSMKIALEFGFKVIGYDMGSFISLGGTVHDTVLFAYFPKKVKLNPKEPLNIIKKVSPIVDKVLEII